MCAFGAGLAMDTHALLLLLRELAVDVAGQQFTHMRFGWSVTR